MWGELPVPVRNMLLAVGNILPMPRYSLAVLQVEPLLLLLPPPPPVLLELLLLERLLASCNIPPMLLCSLAAPPAAEFADPFSCNIPPRPLCSQAGWQAGAVVGVLLGVGVQEQLGVALGREQGAVGSSESSKQPMQRWGPWEQVVLWGREVLGAGPTGDMCFPSLEEGTDEVEEEEGVLGVEGLLEDRAGRGLGYKVPWDPMGLGQVDQVRLDKEDPQSSPQSAAWRGRSAGGCLE